MKEATVLDVEGSSGSDSRSIEIRPLEALGEQRVAAELYRSVFAYQHDSFSVSPRLLRSLLDNGGSALGAFDTRDGLLGFCYGFTAADGETTYHYSQATVVEPSAQGLGIGRKLKHEQARVALGTGVTTMRWAYDPYLIANAHFNLSSLGARGHRFHHDYYGQVDTDRLVVEWPLDPAARDDLRARSRGLRDGFAPHIRGAISASPTGTPVTGARDDARWIALDLQPTSTSLDAASRAALADMIIDADRHGLVALACDTVEVGGAAPDGGRRAAVYLFGRP